MISIEPMTPADIPDALAVWADQPGIVLREADTPEALTAYLKRNPGTSFIVRENGRVIGAALSGHDGRRGFLHHVLIVEGHRRRGLGRRLVETCLDALEAQGILKSHIYVNHDNEDGKVFWRRLGWAERPMLTLMSVSRGGEMA
ncbi:GNAT family N-acetyltransferase [Zavarzinella formosa]|uniref:GNAT family N-acetyltransferase n=1 Tax=Zavarzinella formosa TaxID=360055 RepID=UPI000315E6E0|nr:GNAT family N-acetyltransferase [Zavarzinella formosa]